MSGSHRRLAAAVVGGALVWLSVARWPPRERAPSTEQTPAARGVLSAQAPREVAKAPSAPPSATPELRIHPHPHPLDATRARLAREQQLIAALNDAMDLSESERMRPLLAQYRALVPSDDNQLAAGYEHIADCLEEPSLAARAAARSYYDRARASTLRRYVRRHCF